MRHNLSDTNELIRDRRTIGPEKYSSRKVHKEVVEEILQWDLGSDAWYDAAMEI